MSKPKDYPVILYGFNLLSLAVTAPLWVPVYLIGLLAKKLGIKP